ncbi:MAG: conjugal transfer protein TrbJ [Rhodomicrobium sp.]|nr:conjugal transfer protein TrbJ [Rhodomicrobium sp.]
MTVNTTPFSSLQWGNAAGELQSVNSILAGANTLSFANPAPNGQSGKQYGTYDSYLASPATSEASDVKYQQWSSDIDSSVLSSLKAGNLQSRQMTASEQNAIDRLKSQTGSVQGQLQALQTIAQVGILNAGQLQKLRQLILIDTSLHANRIQAESDRTAYHQAAWKNFLKRPANVPTTGGARF